MRVTYTREMIEQIIEEVLRRQEADLKDGYYETYQDAQKGAIEKMQGAYSAVMVTSDDWPQAAHWFREIEAEHNYLHYL